MSLDIDIQVTGNGLLDDVILSDDSGELSRQVTAMSADASHYNGRFRYVQNTDGGVIVQSGEDFEVRFRLSPQLKSGSASFYSTQRHLHRSDDRKRHHPLCPIADRSDTLCRLFDSRRSAEFFSSQELIADAARGTLIVIFF